MKYTYKLPCVKEKLCEVRHFVKASLNKHTLSELDISVLVLAIDEVCANLIIHTHDCNPNESIEIEIDVQKNKGVYFNIIDKSEIFNINEYTTPSIDDIVRKQRKGGVGLILVKRIMDDIQIIPQPGMNICRLFKKVKVT